MATKKNLTFEKNEAKEQHLKPFCVQSEIAAAEKKKADAIRPLATEELQAMLDVKPDTKDFTGTVVYLCDGEIYKIRVQRPDNTDWRTKRLDDPNPKEYLQLMKEIDKKKERASELEDLLAKTHTRCVSKGFTIAYLNK